MPQTRYEIHLSRRGVVKLTGPLANDAVPNFACRLQDPANIFGQHEPISHKTFRRQFYAIQIILAPGIALFDREAFVTVLLPVLACERKRFETANEPAQVAEVF